MPGMNIEWVFTYHPPTTEQLLTLKKLCDEAKTLAYLIEQHCPESREKSMALTAVQQAVMWAGTAMANFGGH